MLDLPRDRRAGADDLDAAAEHPLQQRRDQRIVRAAEDHRVDLRVAQRARVVPHGVDICSSNGDPRSISGTSPGQATPTTVTNGSAAAIACLVGAAAHGRLRRHVADAAVAGRGDGPHRAGLHDAEHVHAQRRLHQPLPQRRQRGRRGAVAGDHEQLDPPRQELLGDLERERLDLPPRARAVRHPRGVGEVDEVLVRQLHEQLVQHREPTDPGIEHADGPTAQRVGRGRGHGRRDHAASLAGRPDPPLAPPVRTGAALVANPRHPPGEPLAAPARLSLRPSLSIVALSLSAIVLAIPLSLSLPVAATTPAISTPISRIRPTYSTVPCPRSCSSAACARPIHSYIAEPPSNPVARHHAGHGRESRSGPATDLRRASCRFCAGLRTEITSHAPGRRRRRAGASVCAPDARPGRHEHVPHARAAVRSARSCAIRSRRCGGATTSTSSCSRSARARGRSRARRATLRSRYRGQRFDIVHAHFGLTAWPALLARLGPVVVTLHGNDLLVRRSYLATRAALPFTALAAAVSREFSANVPGAGVDAAGRGAAGRDRPGAVPADPARRGARAPRAGSGRPLSAVPARSRRGRSSATTARSRPRATCALLTLGGVAPDEVPYWINAANAVLVPSAAEGFGLSVIEALACGVPAFGTPVGIHPVALHGIDGRLLRASGIATPGGPRSQPHLEAPDPRVDGRARAELFSRRRDGRARGRGVARSARDRTS